MKITFLERNDPLPYVQYKIQFLEPEKNVKYQNALNYAPNALNISKFHKLKRIDEAEQYWRWLIEIQFSFLSYWPSVLNNLNVYPRHFGSTVQNSKRFCQLF